MIFFATTSIIEKRRSVAGSFPEGYILEVLDRDRSIAHLGATDP